MNDYGKIKKRFEEEKTARVSCQYRLDKLKEQRALLTQRLLYAEEAYAIVQVAAQNTQRNLEYHFSNLVTMTLKAVSKEWPEFVAKMELSGRSGTECRFFFKEGDKLRKPRFGSGGGPKDVASFGLRLATWSLRRNRPFFLLDEPFRNVSPDLHETTSETVKNLSDKLKLQILMVSHAEGINTSADKTFINERQGQESKVREIK